MHKTILFGTNFNHILQLLLNDTFRDVHIVTAGRDIK